MVSCGGGDCCAKLWDLPNSASGLEWKEVGRARPAIGRELHNPKGSVGGTSVDLASEIVKSLPTETAKAARLKKDVWEALGVKGLRMDHFIRAGRNDRYIPDRYLRVMMPHNGPPHPRR